ncbi:MAG TPA: hypothetical protein ENN91_05545 [Firmicutes bacterium]|nr:hypothetical protein [Bacillota bacterium]
MKKGLGLVLVLFLAIFLVIGCGEAPAEETPGEEAPEETPEEEPEEEAGVEGTQKLGLGVVTSIARSTDANFDAGINPTAQADVIMAAVLFDEEGKVVSVTIDNAQTRVAFDEELQVATDTSQPGKTKRELGDDYGMINASEIGKEWYEQIDELEAWMIGKTVEEIKNMPVKTRDESHQHVPDVPELETLVTITVEDYMAAVEYAYNNGIEVENAAAAGLGQNISTARSLGLDEDAGVDPMAQADTVMAAVAFDADGVVVGAQIDNAQIRINYDAEGNVVSDRSAAPKTKVQLGDDYGMGNISEIGREWYEQIASLEEWMIGKTVDEITGMPVRVVDDAHQNVPDVPELETLVTITVESYLAAVAEAAENAR